MDQGQTIGCILGVYRQWGGGGRGWIREETLYKDRGVGGDKGWRVMLKRAHKSLTFQGLTGNNSSGLYRLTLATVAMDKYNTLIASELIILMP